MSKKRYYVYINPERMLNKEDIDNWCFVASFGCPKKAKNYMDKHPRLDLKVLEG